MIRPIQRKIKKKFTKQDREEAVLFGLVEMYIRTRKPIGSFSLQSSGFDFLSSATIRNYFSKLEKEGYLAQSHASGGRIPTTLAFRKYANFSLTQPTLSPSLKKEIEERLILNNKEVSSYLAETTQLLSEWTGCSVFLTSPRFDQDFLQNVKIFKIQERKILIVLISDFGLIRTETLLLPKILTDEQINQIENIFLWKLGKKKQISTDDSLLKIAKYCYNEVMLRHLIDYSNFYEEDIYRAGLAKLLAYPEYSDPIVLAKNLSLFEDDKEMRLLLSECMKIARLTLWIGDELQNLSPLSMDSSIIAIPYFIHQRVVGSIAIMGPTRLDYPQIFGILQKVSEIISSELTKNIYHYKISYRQPKNFEKSYLKSNASIYLEDKTKP